MPKKKLPPPLSEGQLEIMDVVWQRGEVTVTEVWQELKSRREIARNTVLTIMLRLDERGWLNHYADGKQFVYSAAFPRQASQRQWARKLVDTVFEGSTEDLVLTLLQERGVSEQEAERIREMIEKAEKNKKGRPR